VATRKKIEKQKIFYKCLILNELRNKKSHDDAYFTNSRPVGSRVFQRVEPSAAFPTRKHETPAWRGSGITLSFKVIRAGLVLFHASGLSA
jgi:hypothetical protein